MTNIDIDRLAVDREYWDEVSAKQSEFALIRDKKVIAWSFDEPDFWGREVIPRPTKQEWDGGLPGSGTICEYQLKHDEPNDEWSKCVIEFVGDHHVVAKCWPDETMPELEQCFKKREVKFRPIKSKKERQREELSALCDDYIKRDDYGYNLADAILSRYNLEKKQ